MIMMVISICPIYKTHTKPMHWQSGLYTQANDKDMCWPPRIDHPNGVYFTKQNKHRLKTKKATFNEGTGFWILGERERKLKNCCLKKTWKLLFESKASTPPSPRQKQTICLPLPRSWTSASFRPPSRRLVIFLLHLKVKPNLKNFKFTFEVPLTLPLLLHHLFGHPSNKSFSRNLVFRRCCKYDLSNRFLN